MREGMRLIVRGRVQGVGFRWWAVGEARRLGLAGWVRNRASGEVELCAFGPPAALDQLASACGAGPPVALVHSVDRRAEQDDGSVGFHARDTA